jgi:hypothetical protein
MVMRFRVTVAGGGVMGVGRRRRRAGVPAVRRARGGEVDPAFHRAILKIALELRKPDAGSYDAVVERTVRAMRLDAGAFRRYLGEGGAQNMSLLLATARAAGR